MSILALLLMLAAHDPMAPAPQDGGATAQRSEPNAADTFPDRFFGDWKENGIDHAGKVMLAMFVAPFGAESNAESLVDGGLDPLRTFETGYGKLVRWERVDSRMLGTLARRDVYLLQQQRGVTRWIFNYVNTAEGWRLQNFNMDEHSKDWFD
ncbi:hypothetical protein [Sphingosinithalassobacter portus]|uniref:hypothetical protein n=1 Tax=Stakelama portus TaxID=2676234 RepID=UPI000D6DEF6E|nr:hypothetical protein [Sphingosinithalassobacter portus]